MSEPDPIAALWQQYDALATGNPLAAARFALERRLFETSRPTTLPADVPKPADHHEGAARLAAMHSTAAPTPEQQRQQALDALAWTRKFSR